MRSFTFSNIIFLSLLFMLVSCSGGQATKTNLVVSHGFSITNSGYEGGLTIFGKNLSTNETFAYSSLPNSSETQLVLDLQKGSWSFSVVGWNGGGSGNNLKGDPYCGYIENVSLNSSAQTVNLNATKQNCRLSIFASSPMVNSSTNMIKPLTIVACANTSGATGAVSPTFCSGKGLSEVEGDDIWSVKVRLPSKPLPGTAAGAVVESSCISASELGYHLLTGYQLPTKNVPFNIITFRDKDCTVPTNAYALDKGYEGNYSDRFHYFISTPASNSENPAIFLASTRSKFQSTPLSALSPSITCSSSSCGFLKTLPAGIDYVVDGTGIQEILLSPNKSCQHFSGINSASAGLTIVETCHNREDGGAVVVVQATDCDSSYCELDYEEDGATVPTKKVKSLSGNASHSFRMQEKVSKVLGLDSSSYSAPLIFSLSNIDNLRKSAGILHHIKEMFSAHGVGGAFHDAANCSSMTGTRYLEAFDEDGIYRQYQAQVSSISENAPRQICPQTVGLDSNNLCSATFDKKIAIRKPINGVYQTFQVMKIDCDNKIGVQEEIHYDSLRQEKRLVYWNTVTEGETRVQQYSYDKQLLPNSTVDFLRTEVVNYSQGNDINNSPSSLLTQEHYEYHSSSSSESITRDEIAISHSTDVVHTSSKEIRNTTTQSLGEIFELPEIEFWLRENSNNQYNVTSYDYVKVAVSPNKNHKVVIVFSNSGATYDYYIYSGSVFKKGQGSLSAAYSYGDVSVNNSGKVAIVYNDASSVKLVSFDLTSATITPYIVNTYLVQSGIQALRAFIGEDDLVTVTSRSASEIKSKIVTLAGFYPSGNLSNGTDFSKSWTNKDNFIIHHISGTEGRFCYPSMSTGTVMKCHRIIYPTWNISSAVASVSAASGTTAPTLMFNSLSTGSELSVYTDPSCGAGVATIPSGSVQGTGQTISPSIAPGRNDFYYKNGGQCLPVGVSYYYSTVGIYSSEITQQNLPSGEGIIAKNFIIDSSGKTILNVAAGGVPRKVSYDGFSVLVTQSSGATLNIVNTNLSMDKSSAVGAATNLSTFGDYDEKEVPVKYPIYNGTPIGLKPQTFINLFSDTQAFFNQ